MRLPRRALVALGLAVTAVAMAASPAGASPQLWFPNPGWSFSVYTPNGAAGYANGFSDSGNFALSEQVTSNKNQHADNSDEYTCTEVWVDWYLDAHRPPDVYTNCLTNNVDNGILPIHWPSSDGDPANGAVTTLDDTQASWKMTVCTVDVRPTSPNWYARSAGAGGNCTDASGAGVGSITPHNDYQYMSLGGIDLNYGCGSACYKSGVSMLPEYRNHGNIDLLNAGGTMTPGSLLVSWSGGYRFVMQHDGNLVLYNPSNVAIWSALGCLKPGEHLVSGSRATLQTDGNFVVYSPSNHAVWASANYTTCALGNFGSSSGLYLKMDSSGNVFETNGIQLWQTGTTGM